MLQSEWTHGLGGRKLKGKEMTVAITAGDDASAYEAGGVHQYAHSELLRPFQTTVNGAGIRCCTSP
ncbi:NAD(P)H-dependent oxidoreductase [Paenibacillus filicis]|uniref:NAD(P)H-dependent oxidoreductase n=1 Tax=Paenibacillus filicis TaxID=669464 RepID=A0ABU9DTK0_9BACL